MPELPEVETIRRGLAAHLVGRRIDHVERSVAPLRGGPGPVPMAHLKGRTVTDAGRHGKHLLLGLDDGATWLVHLGMTGKLLFGPGPARPHTHLRLLLDDGQALRFIDPRRFGALRLYPPGMAVPDIAHHGIDALDPAFTAGLLGDLLRASRAPLKAFLLDQTKVAGVGNIYACEALWRAGLSPRRRACNTPRGRVPLLHASILGVLEDSLSAGGTSFNDYVDAIGREGSFLFDVAVFRRDGRGCPRCGGTVQRFVQAGRSTFHCGRCQR